MRLLIAFMKLLIAFVISAVEENQVMFVMIASICFGLLSGVASSLPGELGFGGFLICGII